ncbi:MAG: hypothetical protein EPN91_02950 [Salinibacterium sp.]|nr:MAG: hypothetical protein EPN91_02950 [Salinibacterium sp.]
MTDNQPEPRYGEYSSNPAGGPEHTVYPYPIAPKPVARRTWDIVLTSILLGLGALNVFGSLKGFNDFGSAVARAFDMRGVGTFTSYGLASGVGLGLNVFGIVLLMITTMFSVRLLQRGRIAFWLPLSAGALNLIIIVIGAIVVMLGDPAFTDYMNRTIH